MSYTTTHPHPSPSDAREPEGRHFKYAGATMLVVAATATSAQYLAAAALGLADNLDGSWSTGGAVTLVAGIVMGATCRTWAYWRRWIWLWVGITTVLAFVLINVTATSHDLRPERTEVSVTDDGNPDGQPTDEGDTDAARECMDLAASIETQRRMIDEAREAPEDDWRHFLWKNGDMGAEYAQMQAEYAIKC